MTIGMWALLLMIAAAGYDDLIIGRGAVFFDDAKSNENTYNILKNHFLSSTHAVLVPFLYATQEQRLGC
jgi:cadmium resistance protein CadD (predicted permease)